jgi:DNA-binding transcriptional ArsR family regulator
MLAEYTREELAAGLDRVVENTLAEVGIHAPPVDAFAVARALGITLAWDDRQQGRARYVRLSDHRVAAARATILLRPDPRWERQQWAVAHEIGEHVACHVFAQWGINPRETTGEARETVANNLAGRLLLPTTWFAADAAACAWDLIAMKARYRTASHELIARRMLECRPPVIISIFDQRKIIFRRSNLAGQAPPPSAAEMECWRNVHCGKHPRQAQAGPHLIQGWPIHEEGWKREILRTELDDWTTD